MREIDPASIENLPQGVDGSLYRWIDLDSELIESGILTEQADAWYYKRNLGNGTFGPLEQVAFEAVRCGARRGRSAIARRRRRGPSRSRSV